MGRMEIRLGLPYSSDGELFRTIPVSAPTLISAGSLFRASEGGFSRRIGRAAWKSDASLDSAGFVAMLKGGYQWSVTEYVRMVVTNNGEGSMPFPWAWWSAMDFCCEQEIAGSRSEVERRIDLTVEAYRETLAELASWRDEGVNDVCDPMPILQGRTASDYFRCFRELERAWNERALSAEEQSRIEEGEQPLAFPGRSYSRHPGHALVGIGSVCRRELHGPEGLLTVLGELDRKLPTELRLHLFGVKGDALPHLHRFGDRVFSIDSQAWGTSARNKARKDGVPCTVGVKAEEIRRWYERQLLASVSGVTQLPLF